MAGRERQIAGPRQSPGILNPTDHGKKPSRNSPMHGLRITVGWVIRVSNERSGICRVRSNSAP